MAVDLDAGSGSRKAKNDTKKEEEKNTSCF
jgi:hypothetical protein